MNKVKLNDVEYKLWFKHVNLDGLIREEWRVACERLDKLYLAAYNAGQVTIHAIADREGLNSSQRARLAQLTPNSAGIHAATVCFIEDEDRNVVATGYSFCSASDQFNKKLGRQIAFNRAVRAFSDSQGGISIEIADNDLARKVHNLIREKPEILGKLLNRMDEPEVD